MKATIELTPEQLEALAPLFDKVTEALNEPDDQRGSILGQVWQGKKSAEFHFLDHQQAVVVNRAIVSVMKAKRHRG
jgi:hypothetical protein